MEATATLKTYRQSPRKVRLVARELKGKSLSEARRYLSLTPKKVTEVISKLLTSVEANAKDRDIDTEGLRISMLRVDEGPTIFRMRPRAHGRAAVIRKRTSHITVALSHSSSGSEEKGAPEKKNDSVEISTKAGRSNKKDVAPAVA